MSESIAVEAAFGSCAKWFPLIGRIDIAMRPGGESFAWDPTQAEWRETSELISRLFAEFGEHSQTVRDAIVWPLEFSQLPTTRIQFGRDAHFSGTYGRQWESAAFAVVDETERLLNEILVSFDPLCDLNSESGASRAIKAIPVAVPTAVQLSTIQQVVTQFCMQCDIPRVCSELRERIRIEESVVSRDSTSDPIFDLLLNDSESTHERDENAKLKPDAASRQMFALMLSDTDSKDWTEKQWVEKLGCSKHAISGKNRKGEYVNKAWASVQKIREQDRQFTGSRSQRPFE